MRRGVCIHKLCVAGSKTGLYGRTVVTFEPNPITHGKDKLLPSHGITPGDIVNVGCGTFEAKNFLGSGVVLSVRRSELSVAFEEEADEVIGSDSNNFFLLRIANDVTYKRLKSALTNLRQNKVPERASKLREVLFGERTVREPAILAKPLEFINASLDDSQKAAVNFAVTAPGKFVVTFLQLLTSLTFC